MTNGDHRAPSTAIGPLAVQGVLLSPEVCHRLTMRDPATVTAVLELVRAEAARWCRDRGEADYLGALVPVAEHAERTGVSARQVRRRLSRGTLAGHRDEAGRWWVHPDP